MTSPPFATSRPSRPLYLGLFLITLATLLFELGLTRIFSVIMYYHMAFFAVSVTLFGMAFGGVVVHFLPGVFTPEATPRWMARMALAFSAATAAALAVLLAIQFDIARNTVLILQICLVSLTLAVPFTCSGVAVALALTRFPRRTNLLYGFDLAGAALGCLLFAPLITWLGGPGFILLVAVIIAVAALVLASGLEPGRRARGIAAALVLTGLMVFFVARRDRIEFFQLRHVRGGDPASITYEGWNAISRITASPGWGNGEGVAPAFAEKARGNQMTLLIDTFAATPIIKFDGLHFGTLFYPFHDISYLAHVLKKNATVAVIGVGGGRDVLAAKAWGQPRVEGIEINSRMREALLDRYLDYAGRPDQWPGVKFYLDEARSHIARSGRKYDIIQASLIDTFAATSAGAFVLTENSLYTIDGWNVFLDHLSDDGILTMSRWYTPGKPVESLRLVTLAWATLKQRGVQDPLRHILLARTRQPANPVAQPTATILVKKSPFTDVEIDTFEKWVGDNQHVPLISPRRIDDAEMRDLLHSPDPLAYARNYRFDLSPPTDDRPFFFDVLRWRDILNKDFRQGDDYIRSINMKPLIMLGTLLATVCLLAFGLVLVPLLIEGWRRRGGGAARGRHAGMMLYFIMLGLAYLMIELTLMQRFSVFLGHPSYSLTVCLFTMLLSSGAGSMAAPLLFPLHAEADAPRRLRRLNLAIFVVLLATLAAAVWVMGAYVASSTPLRIVLSAVTIAPAAFLMGMVFPLGIQAAARHADAPLAWFWGLNGAFSVCASVLTIVLAHGIGLSGTFLCGAGCYFVAALASRAFAPPR